MAIKCANCGQVLPRENARFCNNCGAPLVSPQPNSQQGAARRPLTEQPGGPLSRPDLYEQVAQQPPSRSPVLDRSLPSVPPSWMRTLDREAQTGKPPQKDKATQGADLSPRQDSNPPDKVLRAKVWENNEPDGPPFSEEDSIFPDESAVFPEDSVEDLPTAQLEANILEPPIQRTIGTAPASPVWDSHLDDVAQLSTSHLVSQRQMKPEEPLEQQATTQSTPHHPLDGIQRPTQAGGVVFQKPPPSPQLRPGPPFQTASPLQEGRQQGVVPPTPVGAERIETRFAGLPSLVYRPIAPPTGPKPVSRQGMSRKRLGIVLALLIVLVASGIAVLIIAIKPFAVPPITQPWQQFCDSGLGVSGQYPTGWTKQVAQNQGVHFSDGTDQFSIVSVAANGQDAGTYLKKEASQLGITGLKLGTPASFAGTSWQQAQGSLLQSQTGVTYTETLLVTMHGNRLFTIMQVAPPGTYNEEDTTIFSGMRSSFQFSNSCP